MNRKPKLTDAQNAVLHFIEEYFAEHSIMPTTWEIAKNLRFKSQTAAANHLKALEKRGAIKRLPRKARGIVLVKDFEAFLNAPNTKRLVRCIRCSRGETQLRHIENALQEAYEAR